MAACNLCNRSDCVHNVPVDLELEDGVMTAVCVYLIHMFEERPCPPGDECTAFESKYVEASASVKIKIPGGEAPEKEDDNGDQIN